LAKTHTPPAQQLAHVLRRLACEPARYFKPVAEVRKELALQDGYALRFSGPATALLEKRSIGSTRSGTDIWTARTQIDADPLIEALGLSGKISRR
jgi:hypothetical protein